MAELAGQMLDRFAAMEALLEVRDTQAAAQAQLIKFKDAQLERITFELARLKAWKFGARTERMNAEQRQMFEETVAEDEASLEAQLQALKGASESAVTPQTPEAKPRPRRQPFPEQLRRVEHRHEPESTTCPYPGCGQAMVRIGEDVSERLDIVPAEFFVHRHVHGKWACKCCQVLVQEPVAPQISSGKTKEKQTYSPLSNSVGLLERRCQRGQAQSQGMADSHHAEKSGKDHPPVGCFP
ncbi:IS66 family transposase zinc-finger binding domain-containing protein [Verminephrobacter eiseniae]|uniref:IS66 family transposase zinc-finger binding domain-containing protein n=1 Tax=Verminephrobacter eiseniae TaxID=364317 RepID=UPI002238148F|nr:IS66 family transposase zinc-finger binding domain-containing protein [Verminephrobacter eiseniae]